MKFGTWILEGVSQNSAFLPKSDAAAQGIARQCQYHPKDSVIDKAYEKAQSLNVIYSDAYDHGQGLSFKAVVPKDELVYAQDGYAVNEHFINYLLRQNSDQSRLYKRVQPADRNQYQQQLAANPNQGNQLRQPAANLGQPNQQNQGHRKYQPNQAPGYQQYQFDQNQQSHFNQVPQQFRQPSRPYNPNSIRQFLGEINAPPKFEPPGERALYTCLRSKQFPNYYYYLTDVRGSGSFGTVYGATLLDPNGKPIVNRDGQPIKYCIKIIKSTHIKVKDDDNAFSLVRDQKKEEIADDINKEISMMKKVAGCRRTSQFIESFNQKMQEGVPINVCIVQPDCGHFTLENLAGKSTDFENMTHIMGQILLTAKNIHGLHIIHRDIKLENVAIDQNGLVRFIDFGVARVIDKGDNNNALGQTAIGTPLYMAPEI
ncbi:MAG: protein kinase, partial [Oscillospiraceae bacterium]|nr:protein kinase [Oscillospiraceae bacterium]